MGRIKDVAIDELNHERGFGGACRSCRHWDQQGEDRVENGQVRYGTGICRINPPSASHGFPRTMSVDWCGKYISHLRHQNACEVCGQPATNGCWDFEAAKDSFGCDLHPVKMTMPKPNKESFFIQ